MPSAIQPQELDLLKDKIKDISYAMLTTQEQDGDFHTRPMYTHGVDDDGTLWFFTYNDSRKVEEIHRNSRVGISYAENDAQTYVTLAGTAEVIRDEAKIDELWVGGLKAWFPKGKGDPNITLLKIQPHQGEYWDKPGGKINSLFQMAKGALTGAPDNSQHNEKFGEQPS
ncbi:pyridoxamine 5'-phosphate oxidase family protein [Hymenobacter crusticola]|uniref:Pyridoxamine 5'-phosphate oxidase n=1 Tax=Hymenobacter crusticola TaxID=1770526 RepID=A0A243W899_9BACT|nr:pyridoxamine 5'-phosphate oxidase family protein [Hymenobacter crusticola]OUJ71401.1 pyridoxamine 5'-phosphate oxidase [Hymenobacter crusticola]